MISSFSSWSPGMKSATEMTLSTRSDRAKRSRYLSSSAALLAIMIAVQGVRSFSASSCRNVVNAAPSWSWRLSGLWSKRMPASSRAEASARKAAPAEDFAGVEFNQPPSPDRPVCSGFDGQERQQRRYDREGDHETDEHAKTGNPAELCDARVVGGDKGKKTDGGADRAQEQRSADVDRGLLQCALTVFTTDEMSR